MKSSFWVVCAVTLLCVGSTRCSEYFGNIDENFLDTTRDEGRTLNEEDTESELYKARNTWNDLTNEIDKLSRIQNAEPGEEEEKSCEELCGNKDGVICEGDQSKGEKLECACSDESKVFDDTNKECKAKPEDFCEAVCGKNSGVICKGDTSKREETKCACSDESKVFDDTSKECKAKPEDFCEAVCGKNAGVICKGDTSKREETKCACSDESKVFDDTSKECKVTDVCSGVTCFNGGSCKESDGKAVCECVKEFTGDKCEIFPEDECEKVNAKCAETNGECISTSKDNVKCKCPDDTSFVENDGCQDLCEGYCYNEGSCKQKNDKATCKCTGGYTGAKCETFPKDKCEEEIEKCVETNGTCKSVDAENTKCECRAGYTFVADQGCEKIEKVNCKEVCGEAAGVVCGGNKKNKTEIVCSCKKANETFHEEEKQCKVDYCRINCGNDRTKINCKGDIFEEDEVECECTNTVQDFIKEEKKCKTNFCRRNCGTANCNKKDEPYKSAGIQCSCDETYKFIDKSCKPECNEDKDCEDNANCNSTLKFCQCKDGYEGDDCNAVIGCDILEEKCKKIGSTCVFDKEAVGNGTCECVEGHNYNRKANKCSPPCLKNGTCAGDNRVCNAEKFCDCKDGYEGENCDEVTGCKDLKEKCSKIGTECVFSENAPKKATCECKEGLTYDPKASDCKPKFCFPLDPCPKTANCTFDESTSVGYCQCPENQYYHFVKNQCLEFADKCLLRKTDCDKDSKCVDGKCDCKYEKDKNGTCIVNLCKPFPCVAGANCSATDGSCFCVEGKYFNGKKCEDAKCILKDYKNNCSCPLDTQRKDGTGECVHKKDEEKCDTDCGHGICVKKNTRESCKCFSFATSIGGGKCFLKKSFCASSELQNDTMKCKCEGIYKQADDDITCILKTCDDEDVKKECASKGGVCKMDWKKGFNCECPSGYDKNDKGKCADPCSIEKTIKECAKQGKFCYNSLSANNAMTSTCGCPPTVKGNKDGECSEKAEFSYLIKNILVKKTLYDLKPGINKVLLNAHLIASLKQTFPTNLLDYGYLYDYHVQDEEVNCSIWMNFKSAPDKTELNKIKMAATKLPKACDDCAEAIVWPPNLLLSDTGLKEVVPEVLEFCKTEVKDRLCGRGASCDKATNKCSCDEGYTLIEYSIKMVGPYEVQRCEDVDECAAETHKCPENTECRNTYGSYTCVCKVGFKKKQKPTDLETDKTDCIAVCEDKPCNKGKCSPKGESFDCQCNPGVGGSFCDRADENYKSAVASAKQSTVVVGAVLGTILAVGAVAVIYYIIKKKKKSGSEDFMPAPRMDNAEMTERRNMRGVTNRAYE